MREILINWLISALVVMVVSYVMPGVSVSGFFVALTVALFLGFANAVIKPLAIIFTLPLTIFTLGLFTFVIDALLILFTAALVKGFEVNGFGWALLFSLVLSLVNSFFKSQYRRFEPEVATR